MLQQLLRVAISLAFNPARIVDDAASAARRMTILLVCVVIAAFVLLPALGCAAAGVWILVQHHLGPVWAAFITAAALAIVAVIALVIGLIASRSSGRRDRRARRAARGARNETSAAGASVMEMAAAALPAAVALLQTPKKVASAGAAAGRGFFGRHKGAFLLGAAVVGLVMGQDLFRGRARKSRDSQ